MRTDYSFAVLTSPHRTNFLIEIETVERDLLKPIVDWLGRHLVLLFRYLHKTIKHEVSYVDLCFK